MVFFPELYLRRGANPMISTSSLIILAGGSALGAGFGVGDWLSKWPVLIIVLGAVVAMSTFLLRKISHRADTQSDGK